MPPRSKAPSKSSTASIGGGRKRRPQITRKVRQIDHKNVPLLKKYLNEFGQIEARRRSGNAPVTQRMIATAIKRARILALLPFVQK